MTAEREVETDDEFWGRLLGDDDPAAPGKDWAAAAFGDGYGRALAHADDIADLMSDAPGEATPPAAQVAERQDEA